MIHLRVVAPPDSSHEALELLKRSDSVVNIVHMPGVASKPDGDLILCDVAREDASLIMSDLRELDIHHRGSIAMEVIDLAMSDAAAGAEAAAAGMPSDAVIWEEVEAHTSEDTELSVSFVLFVVLAMLIAMVGIMLDSTILIIGAMVVGPEFGPIAGFCVAIVQGRTELARRSLAALAVGFPIGIAVTFAATLVLKWLEIPPQAFEDGERRFTEFISHPDEFSYIVAVLAGTAGVLSLTSAKSGALVGVLISVTTIPAAANIGVAAAYGDWAEFGGACEQLGVNLAMIVLAGLTTLYIQRRYYLSRRRQHLVDPVRQAAGLPLGRSAGGSMVLDASQIQTAIRRREQGAEHSGADPEP